MMPSRAAARGTTARRGTLRDPSRRGSRRSWDRSSRPGYDDPRATMGAVSGATTLVRVAAEPLSVDEALAFVADRAAGGTCVFVGTVRDSAADGTTVTSLRYESWDELA